MRALGLEELSLGIGIKAWCLLLLLLLFLLFLLLLLLVLCCYSVGLKSRLLIEGFRDEV